MALYPVTFIYELLIFIFAFLFFDRALIGRIVSFGCLVLEIPLLVTAPSYVTDITGAWTTVTIALPAGIQDTMVLITTFLWYVSLVNIWQYIGRDMFGRRVSKQ